MQVTRIESERGKLKNSVSEPSHRECRAVNSQSNIKDSN